MSSLTQFFRIRDFLDDDQGAVTVDFVVLMSMICLFGIACAVAVNSATRNTADSVSASIIDMGVWQY